MKYSQVKAMELSHSLRVCRICSIRNIKLHFRVQRLDVFLAVNFAIRSLNTHMQPIVLRCGAEKESMVGFHGEI